MKSGDRMELLEHDAQTCQDFSKAVEREWLETNGIGGFSSSTVIGANTRRYHGLLTAALNPPLGRFVLLSKLEEELEIEPKALKKALQVEQAPAALEAVMKALSSAEPWTATAVEEALRSMPEALGVKPKLVFQAVRAAVTGSLVSLPLFESISLLGRERTLARLGAARAAAQDSAD